MKAVEFVFDGKDYYILSHRELGMSIFEGNARFLWFKQAMNIKEVRMVSKSLFEILKNKHGSRIVKE
jgi:hypothetical protein